MLNTGTTKPFLTYEQQVSLLESRGLIIKDHSFAIDVLKRINYYRFSAYSLTLRKNDQFYPGVTFENIYDLYSFDMEIRRILLKYCLHVEVAFRSYIAHFHSKKYGPLGYMSALNFENLTRHSGFIVELDHLITRSDDVFIEHHRKDLNNVFPFWVAIEVTSAGTLSKLFKNMKRQDRIDFSKEFIGYSRKYVENWLQCCSYCRNVAAHGGRFYNRRLMACPVLLNKKCFPGIDNTSPFAFVIAIHNLLPTQTLKDSFVEDLKLAFSNYPFALKMHLGFPKTWITLLK